MAAAAIDLPFIAASYSVSENTLTSLVEEPTQDLVNSFLESITAKAREFEEVKADRLRLEVELENAVRGGESKTRVLKGTIERTQKETADLREKLKEAENSRSSLESELQNLKSSSSASVSEVQALNSRIASLESSNRDTLALLESKSTSHDRLAEELSTQHQKIVELRREVSRLEQQVQSAETATSTSKFREQSLQQEVELLKRNNEWFETELKTKSDEYLKYRKEKGARIAELQRQNEDANSTIDSLHRTEAGLRVRLEEINQKADDGLAKIQQLQEEAARAEESARVELESTNRLAELQKNAAQTAKERMQEFQTMFEQVKEDAAEEIGNLRAQLHEEHAGRENAEQQVEELEKHIEKLESTLSAFQATGSVPGTPLREPNGSNVGTPGRFGSPSVARSKGGLTFTQLYTDYTNTKAELDTERRRNERLSSTIDDMIKDLESKQPEMEELKLDHERMQQEMVDMSTMLEEATAERDRAKKEARRWEGEVAALSQEGDLLRQQLRDLSAQVKMLLLEIHARDEGLESLSSTDRLQMERLARGEIHENAFEGMTDTGRFISQHLTIFRDIKQLQEQNMNLLRVTRELGEKMEGEEARAKQNQQIKDQQELESLRNRVERYKDEIKSMVTQSQSYIRERDMFRRMLSHRGQLPQNADITSMFGQSVDGSGIPATPRSGSVIMGVEKSPSSKEMADYGKLLKDMQVHFDAYRTEAAADHRALKEQLDQLSRRNGELQSETARSSSQLTLAHERYEMLSANYGMLQKENSELQKRSQALAEAAAKQDFRTQQVAEELVDAKALVDSMRNEVANLKAEKDLWKKIEKRLNDDNEALLNEKTRLNGLLTSLQNLQNERELSDSETRRKLQARTDSLEAELQSVKRKLEAEVDDGKKAALRREYEHQQNQKRIDDLMASLSSVREELVAAKTTKDHLQARVDELTIELRSAEEKVQALQPRPTPRAPRIVASGSTDLTTDATGEDAISREQELAVEVSELKRDLELTKGELETAKSQVEQYRAISQSSEEELQSLNESHDQYREEMDRIIEERDSRIRELEQRVEEITAELSNTNSELSTLRSEQGETARHLEEQRSVLEAEISRLRDEDERHATAAQFHQEDLKAQAEIAQQAQQNYENELVKHAEAAKALQKTRAEYNQLRTEVAGLRSETEAAKAAMSQNEQSWTETKERYEKELTELRTRKDDADAQNKILHEQLERVTSQIAALQRVRVPDDSEHQMTETTDTGLQNLQEVIRYLRREKEIVDVQYELSVQEAKRLRQQLEYAQTQLDETRLKLDQERRSQVDRDRASLNHAKLLETVNELNLFRESSITLRAEARQAQAELADKSKRVEELAAELQPLHLRVRELENEKELKKGEFKLLQEDRDRWQQRTQNILQKYDRVDPAELESLKEQIASLEAEKETLVAERQPLQEKVDSVEEQIRETKEEMEQAFQDRRQKLVDQFKTRNREQNTKFTEKNEQWQAAVREKEELEQHLSSVREELETLKSERDQLVAKFPNAQQTNHSQSEDANMQEGGEEGQIQDDAVPAENSQNEIAALQSRVESAELKAQEESTRASSLQGQVSLLQSRISELEGSIVELQRNLNEANDQIAQLSSRSEVSLDPVPDGIQEQLERLQQDLAEAQQEVENLRSGSTLPIPGIPIQTEQSTSDSISEQVQVIRADLEAKHKERLEQLEKQFKSRADQMKNQLSKKLTEGKAQIRQSLEAEHAEALDKLRNEHQQEIADLKTHHQEEISRLKLGTEPKTNQMSNGELTGNADHDDPQNIKQESQQQYPPLAEWKPSETEVKDFVANNSAVKDIIKRNITIQTSKTEARVREQQEKITLERLEEARKKADQVKEQAVMMEGKKYGVKISMAENKARLLAVRLEIVETAAKDTPERPVAEVWAIAKDARLPPAQPAAPPSINQTPRPFQTASPGQPATSTFGQPTPPQAQVRRNSGVNQTQNQQTVVQTPPNTAIVHSSTPSQTPAIASPSQASDPTSQQVVQQAEGNLPPKPPQSNTSNAGTDPGALRGLMQQSGIPRGGQRGRGGAGRGGQAQVNQPTQQSSNQQQSQSQQRGGIQSNLPRGAGRGRGGQGRGAPQVVQTSTIPQGGSQQNSPRGALNASARQFVPQGQKRAREDGAEGPEATTAGKRPRGGGRGG